MRAGEAMVRKKEQIARGCERDAKCAFQLKTMNSNDVRCVMTMMCTATPMIFHPEFQFQYL